ncbi:MAG: adenine phosphoribosyltransferase [Bacillota bacterium]|jgi:adenine phosphoribosyltransferase|nr:adenine phosphoribosyltransferase [Bacillota bacterium]
MDVERLAGLIRSIPDFPVPGILFRDITPLLREPAAFRHALDLLAEHWRGVPVDLVAGVESRGFIVGAPVAERLGVGFVPVRKPGKLPWAKEREEYQLEYGTAAVEMHADAVEPGQRVLIVDDLLATGGTASAVRTLVEREGGRVAGFCFLIELSPLRGREKLAGYPVWSLIKFD